MSTPGRRKPSSLFFIIASFFGALLIAGSFSYYNYKFSQFKFIDFNEFVLYESDDLFIPEEEKYILVFIDSRTPDFREKLAHLNQKEYTILAVDLDRQRFPNETNIVYVTAGMNTLIQLLQRFNIYEAPSAFGIERFRKTEYKQISPIEPL